MNCGCSRIGTWRADSRSARLNMTFRNSRYSFHSSVFFSFNACSGALRFTIVTDSPAPATIKLPRSRNKPENGLWDPAMPPSEKCATIIYNSGARSKEEECFAGEAEPVGRCNGGIAMLYSPIICEECPKGRMRRSEEHTSELQSRVDLVCRLLLEKKKKRKREHNKKREVQR